MRHLTAPLLALGLLLSACSAPTAPVVAPDDGPVAGAPADPTTEPHGDPSPVPDAGSDTSDDASDDTSDDAPRSETPAAPTRPAGDDAGDDAAPAPFRADTRPDAGEPSGDLVTLTDIRTGRHDGFDRVVLDVGGDGRPGWDVRYTDDPRGQATGDEVAVSGGAVLEVVLSHTGYPDDTGVDFYDGPRRFSTGGRSTTEVVFDSAFEGYTQLFIGVDDERPFRVRWLDGRVVIDVGA